MIAVTLFTLSLGAWGAEIQVIASTDRTEVGLGDSFTLQVTISSEGSVQTDSPDLSSDRLQNLEIVNQWGPSTQMQSVFSGGTMMVSHSKTYNYLLAANKLGKAVIPAITVVVDGSAYKTDPIEISVVDQPSSRGSQRRQRSQNDIFSQMDQLEQQMFNQLLQRRFGGGAPQPSDPLFDDTPINPKEAFFLRAEADKKEAYVGEQVTANWYLYTRGTITDIDTLKYPTLRGFWKEEIEMATRLNFEQVVLNGIPYQRALLVSYALFPIKAGSASIDPYKAKCTVITPGNMGFGRPYQFTKASPPLSLKVLDVPKENRPSDFTGAVGSFQVSASLDQNKVPAHQPVTWKVRISGRGNAKLIDLPAFDLPKAVELYDQKFDSKFNRNGTSYKEFEILLIPREEGKVEIPSISFSVFNPDKKSFEKIQTEKLLLDVGPGTRTDVAQGTDLKTPTDNKSKAQEEWSIYPTPSTADAASFALPLPAWWSLFAFSFLSVLGHAWVGLGKTKRKETLRQVLKMRLKKLSKLSKAHKWREFGTEMSNGIYKIVGLVVSSTGGSTDLNSLLKMAPPSLRREHGEDLKNLVQEVEGLAFAPEEIAKTKASPENLLKLQKKFESLMNAAIQKVEEE
tara:strand:+ start:1295 stop:3169 length:1875 start_codon:yes stop_codon:yes gene_type:complete